MQTTDQLIRTKLRLPFTRSGLVSRPRLQEKVLQGLTRPLTLITAPAGFGKTTLVVSCMAGCRMPVAWLSLDKNDNQAARFLRYLVASLREADHRIGSEAAELLATSEQAAPEAILTSLINELDAAGSDMALVLDDYQLVTTSAVHEQVAFLLEHCPAALHIVIATRSDPPLPLSRLRARGQTVELRAVDLRFTEPEAVLFLNGVMDLQLDAGAAAVLENRTEGWIAGLQMASIALQSFLSTKGRENVACFIQEFAGTNRFIMDFMLEEVLAREPEEVQAFLLQTSVLSRLTGPLCDAVTGATGNQEMLERLERRNLFVIPLDDERRWYRYHHLFADLLQSRLNQSGAERVAQLLSRAAAWCEQDGQIAEAVSYALAARNERLAAGLIERYWQSAANNGEIETVWNWLNALPEDLVRGSAPLNVAFCTVLWLTGQVGAIEAHMIDAERAMEELETSAKPVKDQATGILISSAGMAELRAVLAATRAFVARFHEEYETAITLAQHALSLISEEIPPQIRIQLQSYVYLALGSAYDGAGDLENAASSYVETIQRSRLAANASGVAGITFRLVGALRLLGRLIAADSACREALAYIQAQGMARMPAAGILHLAMSEVLVERNDLPAAEAHLAQAIALGKWSGRMDALKNSAYALSRLRQARHDTAGALAAVREAEAAMGEPISPLARAELLAHKARALVLQGDVRAATECVEQAFRLSGREQGQTCAVVSLAAARVAAAWHNPHVAIARLTQCLTEAEARGLSGGAIELHILRGLVNARQGNQPAAEADLERALALAAPEGFLRIFLDEGQPMQTLLTQWLARAGASPWRDYAIHIQAQFASEPQPAGEKRKPKTLEEKAAAANKSLVEPLSQRELEVLRLMAEGRTNPEIAQLLIVAPGTIKAHAASIYRKLDAANRTEAVARARLVGILP